MSLSAQLQQPPSHEPTGGRLVSVDGRPLPLTGASLKADARAGVVRVTLEQTFRNPWDEPLQVTYTVPLPADGAVSGFRFRLGDDVVVGEVDTRQQARQRFEDAVLDGRTAALLEQERSSLFTQEVGNVPPRASVTCQVQVDQPLAWLPDGCWEWRFPTVVAPRYLGAPGRVADHARVTVDVAEELQVRLALGLAIRDRLADGTRPESPSHALHTEAALARTEVGFADDQGARLDRDVVVRWRVAGQAPAVALDVCQARGRRFALATLVPPAPAAGMAPLPRDLIVLLDTSGSMDGAPLDQARRVTSALVDSLGDADQLELIEFSNSPRRWRREPVRATAANRRDAQAWLAKLCASGGTEMRTGILEALGSLRPEAQRQVVLITDGLIGFEDEIVEVVTHRLPRGCRVHAIGVGSGVNRSLTRPCARAGRGLELVLGLGEDAEVAVKRLLARTSAPLVTNLEVSGAAVKATAPARLPDLYAGAPALLCLELDPGGGQVTVSGDTALGRFTQTVSAPAGDASGGAAVAALFGREQVEDLELSLAAGGERASIDSEVERLGLEFQLSTRLTSWVAVSAGPTVDPRAPRRSQTMPQALPWGLSAEGVGLRSAAGAPSGGRGALIGAALGSPMRMLEMGGATGRGKAERRRAFTVARRDPSGEPTSAAAAPPSPATREGGPAKKGILERLEDTVFGARRDEESAPAHRVLSARVVRQARGQLTLEIAVTGGPLEWRLLEDAVLELTDGSTLSAEVVPTRTTGEGVHAEGLLLTLTLALESSGGEIRRVFITSGGAQLELAVHA